MVYGFRVYDKLTVLAGYSADRQTYAALPQGIVVDENKNFTKRGLERYGTVLTGSVPLERSGDHK